MRRSPLLPAPGALLCRVLLAVFAAGGLRAQEQDAGYYIERTGETRRFIQRFSWEPEEYASRYEVQMERRDAAGNWIRILEENTGDNFIELSLPAGSYRCRVRAYDLMGRPAGNPEWTPIEILPALQPELEGFTPDRLSLDQLAPEPGTGRVLILAIKGRNLAEAAEFRLLPEKGEPLLPLQYRPEASGENAVLVFGGKELRPGDYKLQVTNPGGLSDSLGTLRLSPPKKSTALAVSAGFEPLVPLYGEIHKLLESSFFPAGAYASFSFLPLQRPFGSAGFETALHWTYISSRYHGNTLLYDVSSHFLGLEAYGLFQKNISPRLSLNLRLGGGLFAVLGFEKTAPGSESPGVNALIPVAGLGLSLRWIFLGPFFAELGAEYTHFFSVDDPPPGYFRPFAGMGFSR
jgi:hypothetical protein